MTAKPAKPTHGGARPGAGRKPRGAEAGRGYFVLLAPEEEAELAAALRDGEAIVTLLREGALAIARRRGAAATARDLTAAPEFLAGTHGIRFTARDGARGLLRAPHNKTGGAGPGIVCDPDPHGPQRSMARMSWYAYDLDQPGTLVDLAAFAGAWD